MMDVLEDSPTQQSIRVAIKICRLSVVSLQICTTLIHSVISKVSKLNYIVKFQAILLFPQKKRCIAYILFYLSFSVSLHAMYSLFESNI